MLREYRLTNFKAFGETVTIPIRPLTLIFGANSSGKSSIFQSLLLLKQTLKEAKNPSTALLPKGSLVDLGTYRDFVHRHETERMFEVEARFALEKTDSLHKLTQKIIESAGATNAGLSVQFFTYDERSFAPVLQRIDITLGDQGEDVISYLPLNQTDEQKERIERIRQEAFKEASEYSLRFLAHRFLAHAIMPNPDSEFWRHWWKCAKSYIDEELDKADAEKRLYPPTERKEWKELGAELRYDHIYEALENYPFEDAMQDLEDALFYSYVDYKNFLPQSHKNIITESLFRVEYFYPYRGPSESGVADGLDISPFILHLCDAFRLFLENLMYLGPLRSQPERFYTFSGDMTEYVGQSGEYLPSILFKDQELVEQLNSDLERLGVKYRVELDKLQYEDKGPSNVFSLRLVDTGTGIDASLRDVGFGISQVLPIVAQSRLSEKKTLLIEQPEIHLHPAHQAELGDMFIRSALGEQKNTLLLETHSENLILRILRRIRETNDNELPEGFPPIRPEDVAILYVQPGENGAEVIEIPVTEDGDFASPWPQGFFEESIKELF